MVIIILAFAVGNCCWIYYCHRSIGILTKENETLNKDLTERKNIIEMMVEENDKLKIENEGLEKSISNVNEEKETLNKDLTKQKNTIEMMMEENDKLKIENEGLEKSISKVNEENETLNKDLTELKNNIEKQMEENDKLKIENEGLEKSIRDDKEEQETQLKNLTKQEKVSDEQMKEPIAQAEASELYESKFSIGNRCEEFCGGEDFSVVLLLSSRPTVGEVRAAVARHMRRTPETTILRRYLGLIDNHPVFKVDDVSAGDYANASGNIRKQESLVKNVEHRILSVDNDPFPVVPGCENRLHVLPR